MSLPRILGLVSLLGIVSCTTQPPTSTPDSVALEATTTAAAAEGYVLAYNEVVQNGSLVFAADLLHSLAARELDGETFKTLIAIYAAVLELDETTSWSTDSDVSTEMLRDMASIVRNISLLSVENVDAEWLVHFKIVNEIPPLSGEFWKDFRGELIHASGGLEIRSMCLVTEWSRASLVLYPANRSPFRPLPVVGYPIVNFTVFDVVLTKVKENINEFVNNSCVQFFDMVNLHWASDLEPLGLRFGCAQWSEESGGWSTERCSLEPNLFNTAVKCYCGMKSGSRATEHIIYEYVDDIARDFVYSPSVNILPNYTDVHRLKDIVDLIRVLASRPTNMPSFELLIVDYLSTVLSFESDVIQSQRNSSVVEDIGSILASVMPEDGSIMIGRGNHLVSGFVVLPSTNKRDSIVAFVFYADPTKWMTYHKSRDTIDAQKVFSVGVEYAAIFSKPVTRRNARYGLVLYPRDKFFAPADLIDGHTVVASRVLDVVLVPSAGTRGGDLDQLVHVYFNPTLNKSALTGCARRGGGAAHGDWSVRGCHVNGDLYDREVCTCRMRADLDELSVAVVQFQFVSFKYRDVDFDNADGGGEYYVHADLDAFAVSVLGLNQMRDYHCGRDVAHRTLKLMMNIVYNPYGTIHLNADMDDKIIDDARMVLILNNCLREQMDAFGNSMGAVCVNSSAPEASWYFVAFSYNKILDSFGTTTYTRQEFIEVGEAVVFSDERSFVVHVSDSLRTQNAQYAFLIYPVDKYLKSLPSIEQVILSSRVVDVILVPGDATETEEQFIELYLDQTMYNSTQACAFWSRELNDWTSQGCRNVRRNSLDVCNCSISGNYLQARSGGQYIVYTFSAAYFDADVYMRLGSESLADAGAVFGQGVALIHNASRLPVDDAIVTQVLQTYVRVLSIDDAFLAARRRDIAGILQDITIILRRYRTVATNSPVRSFGIRGSWSVKSADVAKDLFSNAVLSSNVTDDIAMKSDMTLVSMGLYAMAGSRNSPSGLYFTHSGNDSTMKSEILQLAYTYNTSDVLAASPLFGCLLPRNDTLLYHRLVFIVYPINFSPYPKTMTSFPIFNTRQVDVYANFYGGDYKPQSFGLPSPLAPLDIFFQPSENPKSYIKVACATWNEQKSDWTGDVCVRYELKVTVANKTTTHALCHCNLSNRSETRIVMYEYTEMANFSIVSELDVNIIIFLVVATLSYIGYVTIAASGLVFAKWREELSNKILMHLTISSTLYLTLTTFRETHEIYADTNHDNVALIVFTVCVHYTRLAHFCWGLVMSVLQYKRFSSVVGASTIPHLLLKVSLLAWGTPIVPLVVLLSWNSDTHFCSPDKMTHLVLYLVPGVVITMLNLGLMVAIVYTITNKCGRGEDANLQRHNVAEADLLKRRLKTITLMFFLFGFPTMFEMFNDIGSHSVTVDYFSKILDPIQGFVLCLFFIVFDERSRALWLEKMGYTEKKKPVQQILAKRTTIRR